MSKVIVFDTETIGLTELQIVEAAWLDMRMVPPEAGAGAISMEDYVERFLPTKPIEIGALATHHIILDDLQACRLHDRFCLPDDLEYMIGHNVDFDWEMAGSPTHVRRICTLALARYFWPQATKHTQQALMYFFLEHKTAREICKNAHSALDDVRLCHIILNKILEATTVDGRCVDTWEELWQLSETTRIPTVWSFGKHNGELIADTPDYNAWFIRQKDVDPYLRAALEIALYGARVTGC